MIYFTLPNFHINSKLNFIISDLASNNSEKFKEPVKIIANSGSYPYCYFNGSINNCSGELLRYFDYQVICNNYSSVRNSIRFNFTNVFIEEKDFDNCFLNVLLDINQNGSNYIELNNMLLMKYIKEEYPNYQFVYSMSYDNENLITPELINELNKDEMFDLITIPFNYVKDLSYLKKIKNKNKIEVTINNTCKNCNFYQSNICLAKENELQYNFSEGSVLASCKKQVNYRESTLISLEDIVTKYKNIGIKHFKLVDFCQNSSNAIDYIDFIVDYFIKDEYKNEIRNMMLKEVFFK